MFTSGGRNSQIFCLSESNKNYSVEIQYTIYSVYISTEGTHYAGGPYPEVAGIHKLNTKVKNQSN